MLWGGAWHEPDRPPAKSEKRSRLGDIPQLARLITQNPRFSEVLLRLPQVAATELPVLITGEPGTGKELVAEALWALSPRRGQPLFRLNCAALPPELAASELFGHLKGAFTGADRARAGKFRAAQGGTLFLEEIGDLPLAVQPRMLRALEQGENDPVGGDAPVKVDVRLIAATNQNLPALIADGRFRQDVFDRLAVLLVELPPLRDRGDDVIRLALRFVREEAGRYGRESVDLTPEALKRLKEHHWPGNVRELRNVITRAVLFSFGRFIQAGDLLFAPSRVEPLQAATARSPRPPLRPAREVLAERLRETGGNVSALARQLQVTPRTVYRWLKTLDLDPTLMRTHALAGQGGEHRCGGGGQGRGPLPPPPHRLHQPLKGREMAGKSGPMAPPCQPHT